MYYISLLLLPPDGFVLDRKSTRLNSSHSQISYAVFCLKKKKTIVDEDAAPGVRRDLDAGTLEPFEIGADARGHDHAVGEDGRAFLEGELPLALPLLDLGQGRPRPDGDAVVFQPAGDDGRAGLVHHARQDARGFFFNGEGAAEIDAFPQHGEVHD